MTRFSTLHADGTETNVRIIRQADMLACPHVIMMPEHYLASGACRCTDADHTVMAEWGYVWDGTRWTSPPEDT